MRTVLIGSDFVYNKDGNLVPIELNTNVGWVSLSVEDNDTALDFTALSSFITEKAFTKVVYIGSIPKFSKKLKTLTDSLSILFETHETGNNSITIPYVEDNDETLIIRSAYDTTALVDDTYCKDKINFLNLIKDSTFGSQFACIDDSNTLVSNITTINDNGVHPNFILKAINPGYDKTLYPKFYKVSNESELTTILSNIDEGHFLMEFHLNMDKLYQDHIQIFRGMNILFPPNLDNISLGGYTYLPTGRLDNDVIYNTTTFELNSEFKYRYISNEYALTAPKLLNTDKVELADGSFKTALELEVSDVLKTIDIPNPNEIDLTSEIADFGITYNTFLTGTTYSTNAVTNKQKVSQIVNYVKINFTDDTYWEDTNSSNYLIVRNDNIRFVSLAHMDGNESTIQIGDSIILLDTTDGNFTPIIKEVASLTTTKQIFDGWIIGVERAHLFLTQTINNTSFVTIEHNVGCFYGGPLCQSSGCPKGLFCAYGPPNNRQGCAGRTPCSCTVACTPAGGGA